MKVIDISYASKLYRSKDYADFMEYCLSFDKIEDGDTLDSMGICYRDGKGVTKNIEKAIECFEQAVTFGYPQSANRIGVLFRGSGNGNDLEKAIYWYKIAAENGVADSMYNLGKIYRYENAVKDINIAIGWYEKAAENGDIDAMFSLGIMYYDEEAVRDYNKSVEWYEKGSAKGNASCMFNLGWIYINNEKLKDISKAIYWYKSSGNHGHKKGKFRFAKLVIENGVSEEESNAYQALLECSIKGMDNALNLLTEKAKNGSSVAQFYLGRYYTEMADIENHEQIAYEWYEKSAMQGYVSAQNIILIKHSENTNQAVKEIKDDTTTIIETTAENSKKLDEIANNLMSMNEKIANIRATSFTGNSDTEDNEISAALEKSAVIINDTVKNSPIEKVAKQTEALRNLFGDRIWNRLLPESRCSLVSSAILIRECENMPPEFDYSGICITAVVALEQELKRVFSDDYLKFLTANNKSLPYAFKKDKYYFSLGKLEPLFVFGYNSETKIVEYDYRMREYLKSIVKSEYSYNPLAAFINANNPNCFVKRVSKINAAYRCKAAHSGNVSYDDALDCCYEIYGVASGHIDAKKHSAEIISLIRELYTILK